MALDVTGKYVEGNAVPGTMAPIVGIVLHGSRSGIERSIQREFLSTVNWAASSQNPYGWHFTVGEWEYAWHMEPGRYGINCGELDSSRYIAVEFAQTHVSKSITDAQVETLAVALFRQFPQEMKRLKDFIIIGHCELPQGIADGKTDPFPRGSVQMNVLRSRVRTALEAVMEQQSENGMWAGVGEGVKREMVRRRDVPLGKERYHKDNGGADSFSVTAGRDNLYIYSFDGGVYVIPRNP